MDIEGEEEEESEEEILDFQTTQEEEDVNKDTQTLKELKWADIVKVNKNAQTLEELKGEIQKLVLPAENEPQSQLTNIIGENGNFVSHMPKKIENAVWKKHKPRLTDTEQKAMFPPMDPRVIPEEKWLDVIDVARDLACAPPKPKGQLHGPTARYLRHKKAPYAFNYRGELRAPY
ncbi:hypothetical protein VC83_08478 [Pseudogymnoascus destructans]|uniref:Uncharacterized protein n=2 Tax=Pseudogymnoascus destructans TaxID=655981 RepID=L8FRQ9_PSED2|nr:uncharacterized protein VC83_08478 [Pseudogymnoascus destructans]ELR03138.1 hypothetical protein GMDG_05967 [Pseudogymnoascus destructans 20631-21]OAF55203.1 hypothetical protein VC83_08478 [Pseudogymnoascus destructans]